MTPELRSLKDTIEDALTHHLPVSSDHAQVLTDAMRYATLSGGAGRAATARTVFRRNRQRTAVGLAM